MTSLSLLSLAFSFPHCLFLLLVFFVVVEKCTFSGRKGRKNTSSCGRDRVRQTHRLFFVSLRRDSLTWLQIYFSIPFLSPLSYSCRKVTTFLSLSPSPFSASIEAFKYSKQTCCGKKVTFLSVIITTTLIMSIKLFTLSITSFIIILRRHRVLPLFLPMDLLTKEWLLFLMDQETQGSIIPMLGWLLLPIRPRMKPVPIIPTLLPVKIDAMIPTKRSVSEANLQNFFPYILWILVTCSAYILLWNSKLRDCDSGIFSVTASVWPQKFLLWLPRKVHVSLSSSPGIN